ncbi:hypothetical protein PN497_22310 [Sphaerospermopsis kisseleviana CS-549]|uniref:Uncharacterized protein n=1 Tax=Sphaerospermopsis kisseleviana CS-549 TaxID=3021783 RepID=A0ABT4ZXB9_9CYAN|nr:MULTISPECIES: hypothetical protein [Sphaerospermopsis]MBD2147247.1 hypothetical protein [Sphaerospermopsis sp. FACHB-1194]MDB9444062.1 hypothetical protein [Sphaerospermopsis kisseleviana CS-549]BAZ80272.1 hypothetical protein NIES73_15220 [Sphaerospermopsis kisseleviana NIES-73]
MKTAEKLAAGWLLTLGFMFLTISVTAGIEKLTAEKSINIPTQDEYDWQNPDYENNDTIVGGIIFGVPSLILGGWLALGLYKQSRQNKKAITQQNHERLQSQFYQILQTNNGRITLLGFAMQSQLPAAEAKEYLDQKAKEFNANFQVNEEGGVSYHFDV